MFASLSEPRCRFLILSSRRPPNIFSVLAWLVNFFVVVLIMLLFDFSLFFNFFFFLSRIWLKITANQLDKLLVTNLTFEWGKHRHQLFVLLHAVVTKVVLLQHPVFSFILYIHWGFLNRMFHESNNLIQMSSKDSKLTPLFLKTIS